MNAFFCATPYQIMIAMHLTILNKEEADIYVLNHFENADVIVQRLSKREIFKHVTLVDSYKFSTSFPKNPLVRFKERLSMFNNLEQLMKEYFNIENQYYNNIYLSYPDIIIQLAIKYIYDLNPNVKIRLFEDGTAGYNDQILKISVLKKLFNKYLNLEKIVDHYDEILLFDPKYYSGTTNIKINAIPKIVGDNSYFLKEINALFEYNGEENFINKSFLFLEQPYPDQEFNKKIAEIIHTIFEKKAQDLLVKLHPRTKNKGLYEKYEIYANKKIPWEVISMNNKISTKVLISYYSTACFTNKIIFDEEPIIIFLYDLKELPPSNYVRASQMNFTEKLKLNYRDKRRIHVPKTLNELESIMQELNIGE